MPWHKERPLRVAALFQQLHAEGLLPRTHPLAPRRATDAELLRCHSAEHIAAVDGTFESAFEAARPERRGENANGPYVQVDGDIFYNAHTATAARFAAGCCVEAALAVASGAVASALAVVRPPGHHAECDRAMGFCFYNSTAVAALAALAAPGVARVVVLDWDIHHGNGIQNMLYERDDALYISIHRARAPRPASRIPPSKAF